jgi:hypothetical protein
MFETLLSRNPDTVPDSIIGRLESVISAVMDILGTEEADELMEIAGSDMDLDKKVDVLMQLYPGRVADDPVTATNYKLWSRLLWLQCIFLKLSITICRTLSPPMPYCLPIASKVSFSSKRSRRISLFLSVRTDRSAS